MHRFVTLWRHSKPLPLLALVLLALGACGDGLQVVVVENYEGKVIEVGQKAVDPDAQLELGLWDATPKTGDKLAGPMTYAFWPAPDYVSATERGTPKRGGTVTAGLMTDIDSFNPFLSQSSAASEVQELIFPRLMSEQPDYYDGVPTFTPNIAEKWTIADDNMSIRFTLRKCNWSDGVPISSADVQFSVQAAKSEDVAWVSASIVDFIRDIEIHDAREFTVHYTKPTPYNIMDINDTQIIPKHTFGQVPFGQWHGYPDWAKLATKASGGPWVLKHHEADQEISLKPNPEYWDKGKPYVDSLVFKIFGNTTSMLNALLAGELDIMSGIQPDRAERVLSDDDLLLYTYVNRSYTYLGWNCRRAPFDDARVRQAMTYAINRADIVEAEFYGYADVAAPPIIRSMWASDRSLKPYPHDPDKAEALLLEAGWRKNADGIQEKDGKQLEFPFYRTSGSATGKAISLRVQSDLKKIGVLAILTPTDRNLLSAKLKNHDFQGYLGGWNIATKIDPKPTFHSVSIKGRYNYVNYVDPYVDGLIDRGRIMNIMDPAIREEAYGIWKAFQNKLYVEQPYTMVAEPRGLVGISKKFVNVRVTSLKWLDNVHEWWMK